MQPTTENVLSALARLKQAMAPPYEGGCLCGAMRYKVTGTPFWSSFCHCADCQKWGGSAFTAAYVVAAQDFEQLSGTPLKFERTAASGSKVRAVRCADCGTWVYAERDDNAAFRPILAATLDDPSKFISISNVYVSQALPWVQLDDTLLAFERMPEEVFARMRRK